MLYLFIAIGGYICLATVNIFDKFILSKAVPKPIVFVFYSTAPIFPILLLVFFGAEYLSSLTHYLVAAVSGLFFVLALWAMFKGFLLSEISHAGPLLGAATTFFVLLLGSVFLKENLSNYQMIGVVILMLGSLLVAKEKSTEHDGWHTGLWWLVLSGLFYAISHVAAKYVYDIYGFYAGLVWTRGFMGVGGMLLLFSSHVRQTLFVKKQSEQNSALPNHSVGKQLALVFGSRSLAIIAVLLVQYAIAIGSVTVVNALAGVQYAVLVVAVALLSKFAPKFFTEKFAKGELRSELLAVLVIGAGLALVIW